MFHVISVTILINDLEGSFMFYLIFFIPMLVTSAGDVLMRSAVCVVHE